jgi:hypothetical protein
MKKVPFSIAISLLLPIVSCISQQESALEKAKTFSIKEYCPYYGSLNSIDLNWPIWQDKVSHTYYVELKSKSGKIMSLPYEEATSARKITKDSDMANFIANFRALCEEERPPFYFDIPYIQTKRNNLIDSKLKELQHKYGKIYALKTDPSEKDTNEKFYESIWDAKVLPGIDNTISKGDEFYYSENKKKFEEIRSYRYFAFPALMPDRDFDVSFSEYDFSKGGFYISFRKEKNEVFYGRAGYTYTLFESNSIFLPVPENKAKEIRSNSLVKGRFLNDITFVVMLDKEPIITKEIYACDLGIGVMKIAPETYRSNPFEYNSKCGSIKPKIDKLKTLHFKIVEIISINV